MMIKRSIAIGFELWEVEPVWRNIFISALVGTAVLLFHPGNETINQTGSNSVNKAVIYDPIQGNSSPNNQQSIILPSNNKPKRKPIAIAPVIEADESFQASKKKENKIFGTVGDEVTIEDQLSPTHSL